MNNPIDQPDKEYVVCILEHQRHHPDSVLRKCDKCFENVWCMPFNLIKIPICLNCVNNIQEPKKFILNQENVQAAIDYIAGKKND